MRAFLYLVAGQFSAANRNEWLVQCRHRTPDTRQTKNTKRAGSTLGFAGLTCLDLLTTSLMVGPSTIHGYHFVLFQVFRAAWVRAVDREGG